MSYIEKCVLLIGGLEVSFSIHLKNNLWESFFSWSVQKDHQALLKCELYIGCYATVRMPCYQPIMIHSYCFLCLHWNIVGQTSDSLATLANSLHLLSMPDVCLWLDPPWLINYTKTNCGLVSLYFYASSESET